MDLGESGGMLPHHQKFSCSEIVSVEINITHDTYS